MRIVRFDSQERVDLPDLTQVSFLVLGEFRRQIRGLVIGPKSGGGHDNFILKGYKVEPQSVPNTTVRVRLSLGGSNPLGFAIGAENLGARTDFGQLMGGDDMSGALEGNATQTLDFSGQPAATYLVQMRFVYTDGTNDNRAFWNAGTNTEFVSATDTRHLPLIELRLSGALSAEWIDLASVAWNGVSVSSGDITDLRVFAFEGTTPWQQTTQGGTGGIADFSRSTDRDANGFNEIYPALRGLARQIQDIKGQDSSGNFNWWNRPFKAFDPSSGIATGQTKTLRTLETVTYVIGDGVTTFGDFNGGNGLDQCLALLDAQNNNMAQCVTIVLRSYSASGFQWNVSTNYVLGQTSSFRRLIIRGEGGGSTFPGHTVLSFSGVTSGTAITLADGYLELHNIGNSQAAEESHNITFFQSTVIRAYNCSFIGRRTEGALALSALKITGGGDGSVLSGCRWRGRIQVDPAATGDTIDEGMLIDRCATDSGCLQFSFFTSGVTSSIRNVKIVNCDITMDQTHGWGLRGAIDLNNNNTFYIKDSRIVYQGDFDGIHGRLIGTAPPVNVYVDGCLFGYSATAATHLTGAGGNGANGTGWAVYVVGDDTNEANNIHVRGCTFGGQESIDAGGVRFVDVRHAEVSASEWAFCGHRTSVGTETYTGVLVTGSPSGFKSKVHIHDNTFHRWSDGSGTNGVRTRGVRVQACNSVHIDNNLFYGNNDYAGTPITGRGTGDVAVAVESAFFVHIVGNHFELWEEDTTTSRCITSTGGGNSTRYLTISNNTFRDNGGFAVNISGVQYGICNDNVLHISVTNGNGFSISACEGFVANNNSMHFQSGTKTAITFGAASNNVAMGNRALNGDIKKTSGTVRGYSEATDLNLVNAYS
jgi:hypothetical protein